MAPDPGAAEELDPALRGLGLLVWFLVAAALILASTWLLSYPGGPPGELWPLVAFPLLVFVWLSVAVTWLVVLGFFVFRRVTGKQAQTRVWVLVAGALVLLVGAAMFFGGALRLRFELSEDSLERVAKEFSSPARTGKPRRAGLYEVRWIRRGSGTSIVLITNDCGPAGECGFAYSPAGAPPGVCRDSDCQVYSHLAGPWYVAELYFSGPCG